MQSEDSFPESPRRSPIKMKPYFIVHEYSAERKEKINKVLIEEIIEKKPCHKKKKVKPERKSNWSQMGLLEKGLIISGGVIGAGLGLFIFSNVEE